MLEKHTRNSHGYFCSGFIFFLWFFKSRWRGSSGHLYFQDNLDNSCFSYISDEHFVLLCDLSSVFVCCFYFLLLYSCPIRSNSSLSYRSVNQQRVQWSQCCCADTETAFSQWSLWALLPNVVARSSVTVHEQWKLVIFWTSNFNI